MGIFKSEARNMTEGSPIRHIFAFALPMVLGGVMQLLYNLTDTFIVGKFVGSRALAAVGATSTTLFFFSSFVTGMTGAISVVIAQHYGANNPVKVRKTLINGIFAMAVVTVALAAVGLFGARPILSILQTPAEIIADSSIYLQICVGAFLGQIVYSTCEAVLRGVGDSSTPLYFLILACILNVFLDLFFVLALDMAVVGVAIATVLSQIISALLCIAYIARRYALFRFSRREFRPEKEAMWSILRIGIPQSLQMALLGIGDMTVTSVINPYGTNVIAAFTTASRVQQIVTLIYYNTASAFMVFTGQNFGAHKPQRIWEGMRKILLLVVSMSFISMAIIFFFGDGFVRLFIAESDAHLETIVDIARVQMRISSCFFPFLGAIWLFSNTLKGLGDIRITVFSGMIELASKVGFSFLLSTLFGLTGVWFANPLGWVLGLIPLVIRFYKGRWQERMP